MAGKSTKDIVRNIIDKAILKEISTCLSVLRNVELQRKDTMSKHDFLFVGNVKEYIPKLEKNIERISYLKRYINKMLKRKIQDGR